jgi:chromosome transmission fidelity protein 1
VLFAVIGAKLSEGLNFSDNLARAVIIIGLPFANLASVELQERMKYVRSLAEKTKKEVKEAERKRDAASELYENMCMNAVNQSIGMSILNYLIYYYLMIIQEEQFDTKMTGHHLFW